MFTATVPATGATTLQLTNSGHVLASLRRPTPRPTVRLIIPHHGLKASHHTLTIRWHTHGARNTTLTTTIQYQSPHTGWQTLAAGLTTNTYPIPISMFAHATRIHIRLSTTDGFSTTTTTTRLIKLPHR
jgi:hypothetical protein